MLETGRNQIRAATSSNEIIRNTSGGDISTQSVILTPPSARALQSRSAPRRQLFQEKVQEQKSPPLSPSPSPSPFLFPSPSYASITRSANNTTAITETTSTTDVEYGDYDIDDTDVGSAFYFSDDNDVDESCTLSPLSTPSHTKF